jgi:hypothetical protein
MPRFTATGLRASSVLRLHRVATLSASRLLREIGEVPITKRAEIRKALRGLLAL